MLLNQLQVQLVKGVQLFDLRKPEDSRLAIVRRQRQSAIRIRLHRQFVREPRRELKIGSNLLRRGRYAYIGEIIARALPLSLCFISSFGRPSVTGGSFWWASRQFTIALLDTKR